MTTQMLQLLVIAVTLAGLLVFGLIRDRREHQSAAISKDDRQESLPFTPFDSPDHEHRGVAMSRL